MKTTRLRRPDPVRSRLLAGRTRPGVLVLPPLLAALLMTLAAAPLPAQVGTIEATVVGVATDPQGAVVPGVTVTLTNQGTDIAQQAVTDGEGRYRVAKLPPGNYRLTAEVAGFKTFTIARLTLEVNQTARVDLPLALGQASERVEVTSELALLKTDTPELGAVVYEKLIKELPLNGRNYLGLANLTSGAATVPSFYGDAWGSQAGSYNGMSTNQNQYQLDGSDNTSLDIAVPVVRPSLDAIREFKVQTTQYSAEYGRTAGAVISAVTKSGGNELHGTLWEFIRNDVFDARNLFATTKPPYRQNQFGATLGGPIVRNRVFFFANYEGYRIRQGINRTASVPTALERLGDFSETTRFGRSLVYDPFNLDATGQRVPFPGGKIPASRIHPGAAKALAFYPLPNVAGDVFPNLLRFPSLRDDDDKIMARIDARLSDKDSIFGRFALESQELFSPAAIPLMGTRNTPNDGYNVSGAWTRVLSPRMVNELRGSVSHRVAVDQQEHNGTNYNQQFGYDNATRLPQQLWGFPGIGISGYNGLGGGLFFREPTTNVQFADTLSLARGKHSLKFGFNYNWTDQPFEWFSNGGISHTFAGFYSGPLNAARTSATIGQPFADFLLGVSESAGGLSSEQPALMLPRRQLYQGFVHDTWDLGPNLTVNIGLRYELNLPPYFANGRGAAYIEALPDSQCTRFLTLGGAPQCRDVVMVYPRNSQEAIRNILGGASYGFPHRFRDSDYLFDVDKNNLVPRIGLAWRIGKKTVIRTGYGVFVDVGLATLFSNMGLAAPFYVTNNLSFDRAKAPTGGAGNEFGKVPIVVPQFNPAVAPEAGGFIQAKWAEKDYVDGNVQSWNLNVQHTLRKTLSVEIGYVGNKQTHYPTAYPTNRARPGPGNQQLNRPWTRLFSCDCFHSFGDGNYHSVQFEVEQRFAAGLSFRSGYTFGRSINNFRARQDEYEPEEAKALANWDRRQTFFFTNVYEIPLGQTLSGFAGALLKGWQVASILTLQSGPPFGVTVSADISNIGSRRTLNANRVSDGRLAPDARTPSRWFDTTAFQQPAIYRFGNGGYNILDADGIVNLDAGLSKRWVIGEGRDLQFRFELFNLANHPNLGAPGGGVDSGAFGRVASAATARQIQFGLRFQF